MYLRSELVCVGGVDRRNVRDVVNSPEAGVGGGSVDLC